MNFIKSFFGNAVRDISIGIAIAAFLIMLAGATVAAAQGETETPANEIDLGEQHISAVDTSAISDSVKIIESKIRTSNLREIFFMLSIAREKYAKQLDEIDRAIARRKEEK